MWPSWTKPELVPALTSTITSIPISGRGGGGGGVKVQGPALFAPMQVGLVSTLMGMEDPVVGDLVVKL